jgi:phosphatidylglycerophosphate synthase
MTAHVRRALPQLLTAVRVVLGASIFGEFVSREWWLAAGIVAAVTDTADGVLARRWSVQSRIGSAFDLLADAIFFVACFWRVWTTGVWPTWLGIALLASTIPKLAAHAVLLAQGRPGSSRLVWNRVLGYYAYGFVMAVGIGGPPFALGIGLLLIAWWANTIDLRRSLARD